jgi:molybdopterin molybdotransferase
VEIESVQESADTIIVDEPLLPGRNIRKSGEDVRKGTLVMKAGTRLTPSHVGVLAALGCSRIEVFRTPHASVVTTGSELVSAAQIPAPGQIRNSSAVMVPALLQQAHARVDETVTLEDEPRVLAEGLRKALTSDLLITTGGVSVGKYDLVLKTLESLGVEFLFWKVNIKPGMPLAFGRTKDGTSVFCLPGNPVSSAVTFLQFVRPALDALEGARPSEKPRLRATLEQSIEKRDGKRHFSRGVVSWQNGRWTVRTTGTQSSGVLSSLAQANCLMIIPESDRTLAAGTEVEVELL